MSGLVRFLMNGSSQDPTNPYSHSHSHAKAYRCKKMKELLMFSVHGQSQSLTEGIDTVDTGLLYDLSLSSTIQASKDTGDSDRNGAVTASFTASVSDAATANANANASRPNPHNPSGQNEIPRRECEAIRGLDQETTPNSSMTYPEYRTNGIKALTQYIYDRYVVVKDRPTTSPREADQIKSSNDDDNDDDDDDDKNRDSQSPSSPPPQDHPESQSNWMLENTKLSSSTKTKRPAIPLVQDTHHTVHTISQIDMYTKSLFLHLTKVEKVWPLRLTKRMEHDSCHSGIIQKSHETNSNDNYNHNNSSPRTTKVPFSKFGHFADDGPLSFVYKHVLTLELVQLSESTRDTFLHQTASNVVDPRGELFRRLIVHLYNDYARRVSCFLQQHDNCTCYCRLECIPAACIFPYRKNHNGPPCAGWGQHWFDDDICDHVVCIGGKSLCRTSQDGDRMYFENSDLKLYLLAVPDDPKQPQIEYVFDKQGAFLNEDLILAEAMQSWNKQQERFAAGGQSVEPKLFAPLADSSRTTMTLSKRQSGDYPAIAPTMDDTALSDAQPLYFEGGTKAPPSKRTKIASTAYEKLINLHTVLMRHATHHNLQFPSVTVLGVMIAFSLPTRTKTNQWMISISIVDPSLPVGDGDNNDADQPGEGIHAILVNIFRRRIEDLPSVRRAGDLIRLDDAGIQEFRGEMQLLGRSTTKIHIFSRNQSSSMSPFECDLDGMQLVENDMERLQTLWEWGQKRMAVKPTMKRALRFALSDVASLEEPGDCTAMVCGLCEIPQLSDIPTRRGFLRLWDGTGAPSSDPLPLQNPAALSIIKTGDPPKEALVSLHSTIRTLNTSPNRTETSSVLSEIVSVCGRVVNMAIWESPQWSFVQRNLKVGDFIRVRNVGKDTLPSSDLICLMAKAKTWLVPIPEGTLEVRQLLVDHQRRMERHDPPNPASGILPMYLSQGGGALNASNNASTDSRVIASSSADDDDITTLATCELGVGIYSCQFSITKILPECQGDMTQLCTMHQEEGGGGKTPPSYRFAVNLVDTSNEFVALVVDSMVGEAILGKCAVDACRMTSVREGKELLAESCRPGLVWRGVVETRVLDEESFFILKSVEKIGVGKVVPSE